MAPGQPSKKVAVATVSLHAHRIALRRLLQYYFEPINDNLILLPDMVSSVVDLLLRLPEATQNLTTLGAAFHYPLIEFLKFRGQ